MIYRNIDSEFIYKFLSTPTPKLILTHENADPDAIGSGIVLQEHFPNITLGAYNTLNKVAARVVSLLDVEVVLNPTVSDFEKLIVLDSSSPAQIGHLNEGIEGRKMLVIDHHIPGWNWPEGTYFYVDDSATSLSQIIFQFIEYLIRRKGDERERFFSDYLNTHIFEIANFLSRKGCLALLSGIVTDTAHFKHADAAALFTASLLLQSHEIELGEVLSLVNEDNGEDALSKKIAHLKAGQRLKFEVVKDSYIVGYSTLSSFEGSACSKLLISGCDVILILSEEKGSFRVAGRAKYKLTKKGLHLGSLFLTLAKRHGWSGGGHAGAAGISGEGNGKEALLLSVSEVKKAIQSL